MNDLVNPLFSVPILIVVAEMLAVIYLSRRRIKWRLAWIMGSYVSSVIICFVLGLVARDEFGFSFIPLLVICNPWSIILGKLVRAFPPPQSLFEMLFGILLNCAIFYILDKVSYPKHSARLPGQQAAQRSQS